MQPVCLGRQGFKVAFMEFVFNIIIVEKTASALFADAVFFEKLYEILNGLKEQ